MLGWKILETETAFTYRLEMVTNGIYRTLWTIYFMVNDIVLKVLFSIIKLVNKVFKKHCFMLHDCLLGNRQYCRNICIVK